MKNPEFSVIVPVYNSESYFRRCLDSILAQTFNDYELIIVDDGSSDSSGEIADEYAEKNSRISVIHQQNQGLSAARNTGLEAASGRYVCFADSDDTVTPDLLSVLLKYTDKDYDIISYNRRLIAPDGTEGVLGKVYAEYPEIDEEVRRKIILEMLYERRIGWESWSMAYRREMLERYHLRFFDNRIIYAEDLHYTMSCLCRIHSMVMVPDVLYVYYQRTDSLSGRYGYQDLFDRMITCAHEIYNDMKKSGNCQDLTDHFPIVYFGIMRNEYLNAGDVLDKVGEEELRRKFRARQDDGFHMNMSRRIPQYWKELLKLGKQNQTRKALHILELLLGEPYLLYRFKRKIGRLKRKLIR